MVFAYGSVCIIMRTLGFLINVIARNQMNYAKLENRESLSTVLQHYAYLLIHIYRTLVR